jgi:hypothetical protein
MRYLLAAYPLTLICAAVGLCELRRALGPRARQLTAVALLALGVGVLFQARGLIEIAMTKVNLSRFQRHVAAARGPVVTDRWWLAAALPTRFIEQEFYTVPRRRDLEKWLETIGREQSAFLFVSPRPLSVSDFERLSVKLRQGGQQILPSMSFTQFDVLPSAAVGQPPESDLRTAK